MRRGRGVGQARMGPATDSAFCTSGITESMTEKIKRRNEEVSMCRFALTKKQPPL